MAKRQDTLVRLTARSDQNEAAVHEAMSEMTPEAFDALLDRLRDLRASGDPRDRVIAIVADARICEWLRGAIKSCEDKG